MGSWRSSRERHRGGNLPVSRGRISWRRGLTRSTKSRKGLVTTEDGFLILREAYRRKNIGHAESQEKTDKAMSHKAIRSLLGFSTSTGRRAMPSHLACS